MARPLRISFPDGVYHVTSRGDRRERIFVDDTDRGMLLGILAQACERFDASALAYCLMGNHYHFVLQSRRANLSRLMRHINGVYAQAFNRRHGMTGHLFQGRFTSIHVDRDAYLLEVCRYTDLNPVRAGMVDQPSDWPWSSYRSHAGLAPPPPWLDVANLRSCLIGDAPQTSADHVLAAARYRQLVADGRDVRLWETALRQGVYLGDDAFVDEVQKRMAQASRGCAEIPREQRQSRSAAIDLHASDCSLEQLVHRAYVHGGMSMPEIARSMDCSVSQVSRLLKRGEAATTQLLPGGLRRNEG